MRLRPPSMIAGTAVIVIGAISVFDFLQIGRRPPAEIAEPATMIVVEKNAHRMTLMRGGKPIKTYAVALGRTGPGPKQREGDGHTPDGKYTIDAKNPRSRFHLALHISYPSAADRDSAQQRGVAPGGDIMIHGLPNGLGWLGGLHRALDWTDGCIAVTNPEMDEIYAQVASGTTVEIKP
jgi:murein L,D-transpeptidase YafK